MTKCRDCEKPAEGVLQDCCDNFYGTPLCEEHRDFRFSPRCDTEWISLDEWAF